MEKQKRGRAGELLGFEEGSRERRDPQNDQLGMERVMVQGVPPGQLQGQGRKKPEVWAVLEDRGVGLDGSWDTWPKVTGRGSADPSAGAALPPSSPPRGGRPAADSPPARRMVCVWGGEVGGEVEE